MLTSPPSSGLLEPPKCVLNMAEKVVGGKTFTVSNVNSIFQLSKHKNETKCLTRSPTDFAEYYGRRRRREKKIPGQLFSVDQQCQQAFGMEYRYCGVSQKFHDIYVTSFETLKILILLLILICTAALFFHCLRFSLLNVT